MNTFAKLSDPVYFSRFGNRFNVVFSILSIFFWCFLIYMSVDSGKPLMGLFWGMWILLSVSNMVRSMRKLKQMRGVNPEYHNAKRVTPNL